MLIFFIAHIYFFRNISFNKAETFSDEEELSDEFVAAVNGDLEKYLTNLNVNISSLAQQHEELTRSHQEFSANFTKQGDALGRNCAASCRNLQTQQGNQQREEGLVVGCMSVSSFSFWSMFYVILL